MAEFGCLLCSLLLPFSALQTMPQSKTTGKVCTQNKCVKKYWPTSHLSKKVHLLAIRNLKYSSSG